MNSLFIYLQSAGLIDLLWDKGLSLGILAAGAWYMWHENRRLINKLFGLTERVTEALTICNTTMEHMVDTYKEQSAVLDSRLDQKFTKHAEDMQRIVNDMGRKMAHKMTIQTNDKAHRR